MVVGGRSDEEVEKRCEDGYVYVYLLRLLSGLLRLDNGGAPCAPGNELPCI